MLGKLIKYEWKDIYKVGCILSLVIIAVTALGCIMLQLPSTMALFGGNSHMSDAQVVVWVIMGIMSLLLYVFILVGATYGLFIFLGIRFYRTMYTDQGYLTNTLPVTSHQLLISKILVSGIWYLILQMVVIASVFALVMSLLNGILADNLTYEGYGSIWEAFGDILPELGMVFDEAGFDLVHYGVVLLLIALIGPFSSMAILFGSITLGQLSRKHKALMGILAYLGVMFANMIIASIVQTISSFRYTFDMMRNDTMTMGMTVNMSSTYDCSLILTVIMSVALYASSHYILTRKLNMD